MKGWMGKFVEIDLTDGSFFIGKTDVDFAMKFLGGRGLGVFLLKKEMKIEPFDPRMPIFIGSGPLAGTPFPSSCRLSMVFRSPLTMTVFDTEAVGDFSVRLKQAGFDYLIIRGRAKVPSLIRIENSRIKVEPCHALWGKGVNSTVSSLNERGASILCIGPAGERMVSFASVSMDGHTNFGRGGGGAVWGSKNLKAIVVKGRGKVDVADCDSLNKVQSDIMKMLNASPFLSGKSGLINTGTLALLDLTDSRRMMPVRNFSATWFPETGKINAQEMKKIYGRRNYGCYGCPVKCKKFDLKGNPLPEFQSASHLGPLNDNDDIRSIYEANLLCNDMGLDTISFGGTMACYGEFRQKFVTGSQLVSFVRKIAMKEKGDGESLAEGSARWAEFNGCKELSMTVKGLELPAYDPRGAYGMALGYAVSNRGGCHLRSYPVRHEILRRPVATNRFSFEGKARIIKIEEDENASADSLLVCKFLLYGAGIEECARGLTSVTGISYDAQDLLRIGSRIVLLERWINAENGFSKKDDKLPERFFNEPGSSDDRLEIPPLPEEEFELTLQKYYKIRGCNENGVPRDEMMDSSGAGK